MATKDPEDMLPEEWETLNKEINPFYGEDSIPKIDQRSVLPGDAIVVKSGNNYVAYSSLSKGGVYMTFSEVLSTKQSIDCVIKLELNVPDGKRLPISQRIDLRSASARNIFATTLNAAYGGKPTYNWVLTLSVAFEKVIQKMSEENKPIDISEMLAEEPAFLLHPFLQENVSNLLFAQSEAGKTWFAITLSAALTSGVPFLGYTGRKSRILFMDYEDDVRTFVSRLHKVCHGMGKEYKEVASQIQYFKPHNSLRQNIELIKTMVSKGKFDLLVIDAGGDAAGGSPSDEEKVLDLFNALEEIPCTKLILHHEPKYVVSEQAAFYGSMYWRARSRVGWRLEVEKEEGSIKTIKASLHKRSNLPYIEPIYYEMHFDSTSLDEMFDNAAPLQYAVRLTPVNYVPQETPLPESILLHLQKNGEMKIGQLRELTGAPYESVRRALHVLKDEGRVKLIKDGKGPFLWRI